MLEAELEAITIHRATVMLVDITGVPIVDTSVALQLIRAADAAKLLGCQTILVGLEIDLRGIATHATLADGLETSVTPRPATNCRDAVAGRETCRHGAACGAEALHTTT